MTIKQLIFVSAFLVFSVVAYAQEEFTISGYVKDFKTEEPIIGAAVFEYNTVTKGTPTDTEGYFSLTFSKNDIYLKFAYIGFTDTVINLFVFEDTVLTVFLKSSTDIKEVEIERDEIVWHPEYDSLKGEAKVIIAEVVDKKDKIKPTGFYIKKEKKKVSQKLTEMFLQTGNGTNQILTYIDGLRLYSTNRVFNFMPLIDNNAIESYKYYYGNFPATYGSYISPVLDIKMDEGDMRRFKAGGTVSLMGASIYAGGPIIENSTSFFVSAGRTFFNNPYTDLLRNENVLWTNPVSSDLNMKVTHQLNENNKFNFSFLTNTQTNSYEINEIVNDSIDYLFNRKISEKTGNTLSSLQWEHVFSPDLYTHASFIYSRYNLNYNFEGDSIGLFLGERSRINDYNAEYTTGNEDIGLNINLNYNLNFDHYLEFGASAVNHHFRPIKASLTLHDFVHINHIDTSWEADTYNAQEFIVFVQDTYQVNDKLNLQGGIHFSAFKTAAKTYFSVQPRLYATYKLFKHISLNASYSNYKQYIHQLSNRQVGLSANIFVASDESILPQFTHYTSAGIEIELPFEIELIANAYYMNSNNVVEYKEQYGFFNFDDRLVLTGKNMKDRIEQGKENVYGLRLMLNKEYQKFTFKAAHYFSVSDREFENLNFGEQFSYRHNKLHDFKLEISYKINENFKTGINWIFQSGNHVTLNKQSYIPYDFNNGTLSSSQVENPVYSAEGVLVEAVNAINAYQLSAYHRADLFVNYTLDNHTFGLHVYNLYNRKNSDYVDFERGVMSNTTNYQIENYSTLPFFPVLNYTFRFE